MGPTTSAKVMVPESVERRQAGVERGRDGGGLDALGGDAPAGREVLAGRQPGRGPLPGDDLTTRVFGVVDQDRHLAAEAERGASR